MQSLEESCRKASDVFTEMADRVSIKKNKKFCYEMALDMYAAATWIENMRKVEFYFAQMFPEEYEKTLRQMQEDTERSFIMMDDLIKRQDVIDIIMGDGLYCDTYDDKVYSAERIKNIPTVVPSEYCDKLWKTAYERGKAEACPKKGKWMVQFNGWGDVYYECSCCKVAITLIDGTPTDNHYYYCPNCGVRMEE